MLGHSLDFINLAAALAYTLGTATLDGERLRHAPYAKFRTRRDPGGLDRAALRITTYSEPPLVKCPVVRLYAACLRLGGALIDRNERSVSVSRITILRLCAPPARLIVARHERALPRHFTT